MSTRIKTMQLCGFPWMHSLNICRKMPVQRINSKWRKDNVCRFVVAEAGETCEKNSREYVRLRTVPRFVFQYMPKVSICQNIANEVEMCFTGDVQHNSDNAIYDLYHDEIANSNFKNKTIDAALCHSVNVPEHILILYGIHQQDFTPDQWRNISFFEYHYG